MQFVFMSAPSVFWICTELGVRGLGLQSACWEQFLLALRTVLQEPRMSTVAISSTNVRIWRTF
eukprot:1603252-Amphidinium_carterae.1